MKSKELLKLNETQSIVEIEKGNSTEYCVCGYYDNSKPEGEKWCWGHYFSTLENAIKYAALNCYKPIDRYIVIEAEDGDIKQNVFSNYDEAHDYFIRKINELKALDDCYSYHVYEDYGELKAIFDFSDDDNDYFIIMKLTKIQV